MRESILIDRHKIAARRYRALVLELQRKRGLVDHDTFVHYENDVVAPARRHCLAIFQQWLDSYGAQMKSNI